MLPGERAVLAMPLTGAALPRHWPARLTLLCLSVPRLQGRLYNKQAVLEWLLARAGTFAVDEALHRHMNVLRESGDAFNHNASMK